MTPTSSFEGEIGVNMLTVSISLRDLDRLLDSTGQYISDGISHQQDPQDVVREALVRARTILINATVPTDAGPQMSGADLVRPLRFTLSEASVAEELVEQGSASTKDSLPEAPRLAEVLEERKKKTKKEKKG